jgi:Flavin containing amine oxidoreductase
MPLTRRTALGVLAGSGVAAVAGAPAAAAAPTGVIRRDVCVIGGGSSGTYTAVRLRDLGRSVAVVESQDRLGGHCETFHDPVTGGTTDIGVIVFHDLPLVRDYFARFDVPLVSFGGFRETPFYVDYRTGKEVSGYAPPVPVALPAYLGLLQQFPYLATGFDLPDPVPPTLLMPFGDLVEQAGLDSIVQLVFGFGQGIGDLLRQPVLYVMKLIGLGVIQNVIQNSFLTTARQDNSELYEKATDFLGDDVLLNARVTAVRRSADGVRVRVLTPGGPRTIHCAKLVVTAPPVPRTFAGFDLDPVERRLFAQFRSGAYWTAVARLSGLPQELSVVNVGADTRYNLPPLPGIYSVTPTGIPDLWHVKYGSPVPLPEHQVRRDIAAGIRRLATAGTVPITLEGLEIFKAHVPFELTVGTADIAAGFYRELNALQGRNHTYYNGAAFQSHNSSELWQFTEVLLPRIAA